jgi:Caspase domain
MDIIRRSLIIGVNNYRPSIGALNFCASDARNIEKALNTRRDGFTSTESRLLSDEQSNEFNPTRVNIIENIIRLCQTSTSDDTVIIHFSGHGEIGKDENLYLLPMDASPVSLEDTSIAWKWIQDQLDKCEAKNKILILDACHSGAGRDTAAAVRKSYKVVEDITNSKEGYVCISACSGGQLSYELLELEQGIFSYYLASGILGAADPSGQGVINIENLFDFVSRRTIHHAKQMHVEQEPYLLSKISSPLHTYTISAASLDRPINNVLVLTENPFLGNVIKVSIETATLARSATYINDIELIFSGLNTRFDYDAVFIDVESNWKRKEEFILSIRERYPIVPFVLVGQRMSFLDSLNKKDRERFSGYFFFDINTPISQTPALISDELRMVEWDIRSRYGEISSS